MKITVFLFSLLLCFYKVNTPLDALALFIICVTQICLAYLLK